MGKNVGGSEDRSVRRWPWLIGSDARTATAALHRRGRRACRGPALQHVSAQFWVFFFFFFFSFFLFLLCGRRNRKQGRTPSQTGSLRHFGTNLGQPLWTEALHWPQSNSTREEPMLPARRHLSFLACSPAARAAPTRNHCAPPPVIRVLSSFFSFH